jgi:hypothetical protein
MPKPKKKMTLEKLAAMMARGFAHTPTKTDVAELRQEITAVKTELKGDIASIREEMASRTAKRTNNRGMWSESIVFQSGLIVIGERAGNSQLIL